MGAGQKIAALVVAAGSGSRTGAMLPKQFMQVGGKAVVAHAIDRLRHPLIQSIQVVIGPGQEKLYRQAIGNRPLPPPILGGATRQQSVRNGIEALAAAGGVDAVLIHDAARPFLPSKVLEDLIDALDRSEAAVPALPVADTMALCNDVLGAIISRDNVVKIQTPQAFRFSTILEAHRQSAGDAEATDDAQLVRAAGQEVVTVPGDERLQKLTYADDFARAEERLAAALVSRTGTGFDVHAFAEGEELWLGGLQIPHRRGLSGHSDADVLLHAITDALLGTIGAGDIGDHFPPSGTRWKSAPSSQFVEHARQMIAAKGGRIEHVDSTIICEEPRIGPHRQAMRENIAHLLGLTLDRISVKATTTERLGFTGRGEGIAAQAVATVRLPEDL